MSQVSFSIRGCYVPEKTQTTNNKTGILSPNYMLIKTKNLRFLVRKWSKPRITRDTCICNFFLFNDLQDTKSNRILTYINQSYCNSLKCVSVCLYLICKLSEKRLSKMKSLVYTKRSQAESWWFLITIVYISCYTD